MEPSLNYWPVNRPDPTWPGQWMLLKSLKQKLSEAISEMDMGPYLLTQPNPTANGSNPTQPIIFW